MASISVTSADVRPLEGAIVRNYQAGAALTVGYSVYLDSSGYVQHSDSDASEAASRGRGIVVASKDGETSVTSGDRCSVCVFGPVGGFASMTPGESVYVSNTAGRIDQTQPTSAYRQALGYADSATVVFVNPDTQDPSSS
ncbi:MAG: hypothetical protein ACYTBJ_16035 [Planctomycetota bacterium]|jgi:hypothetical protein